MLAATAGAAFASDNGLGSTDLAKGMSGKPVKTLQTDLTIAGYPVKVSGQFGSKTVQKVKAFQKHYKLGVDGVVGPKTKKKLVKVVTTDQGDKSTGTAASSSGSGATSTDPGGVGIGPAPKATVKKATLIDGLAIPAPGTPAEIENILAAGNRIAFLPYIYGGGHSTYKTKSGTVQLDGKADLVTVDNESIGQVDGKLVKSNGALKAGDSGYDCSGSVSFALYANGHKLDGKRLITAPMDSTQYESWGKKGKGKWITVYANADHAYMTIAGLRFDTVAQDFNKHGTGLWRYGDRWTTSKKLGSDGYAASSFVIRHPAGW